MKDLLLSIKKIYQRNKVIKCIVNVLAILFYSGLLFSSFFMMWISGVEYISPGFFILQFILIITLVFRRQRIFFILPLIAGSILFMLWIYNFLQNNVKFTENPQFHLVVNAND